MITHLSFALLLMIAKSQALPIGAPSSSTDLNSKEYRADLINKVAVFGDDRDPKDPRMTAREAAAKYRLTPKQIDEIRSSDLSNSSSDCLSEVFRMIEKPDTVGLGDVVITKSGDNSIIYSPNGRSTTVTSSGNCGPSANGSSADYKKLLTSAFDEAQKRVQSGLISSNRFDKAVSRCQRSKNPVIHDIVVGLMGTYDQTPSQSGSPAFKLNRPSQDDQGAGSSK